MSANINEPVYVFTSWLDTGDTPGAKIYLAVSSSDDRHVTKPDSPEGSGPWQSIQSMLSEPAILCRGVGGGALGGGEVTRVSS